MYTYIYIYIYIYVYTHVCINIESQDHDLTGALWGLAAPRGRHQLQVPPLPVSNTPHLYRGTSLIRNTPRWTLQ
jgi:hypothetical protein